MSLQTTLSVPAGTPPADFSRGSVYFIGTATVILRYAGFTILTDPNFIHRHEQVDLGNGLSATRLTDPAMELGSLPQIDLVVLSHFHGDHFDQLVQRDLNKGLPIVTTREAERELRERGFHEVYALDPWGTFTAKKGDATLRLTAMPGRHGPPVVSFALPDVMGSLLNFEQGDGERRLRVYITGDTLMIDDLREIPQRFPGIDLALLHLGRTRALGILVTMDAGQGVELLQIIQPEMAIPIHYNDYDVFKSPLEDFQSAVEKAGLSPHVRYLRHGETYEFTR